jgi:hypothetical protein
MDRHLESNDLSDVLEYTARNALDMRALITDNEITYNSAHKLYISKQLDEAILRDKAREREAEEAAID